MQLKDYQIAGTKQLVKLLRERGSALLADEMGLGKTAQAIHVALELAQTKTIVVCPASLRLNWIKEIKLWGGDSVRSGFLVESYEWYTKNASKLTVYKTGLLIIDESHYCKNRTALRTKACLTELWSKCKYKLLMTGTPCPNGLMDGWSLFNKLDPESFPNKYKYGYRYCQTKRNWFTGNIEFYGANKRAMPELRDLISKFMVRRKKKDVQAELPPKVFSMLPVAASVRLGESLTEIELAGALTGAVQSEAVATKRKNTGRAKVLVGSQIIKDIMTEKDRLVVFTYHLEVSDELKEALTCGDFKVHQITGRTPMHVRDQIVTEFQDTTTESKQVLLAQIEAAGVGINLHAADTGIFFELDWVPARTAQAIDRLHRLGQDRTVQIIYLVAHNTLDTQIIDSLREKIEAIQGAMK